MADNDDDAKPENKTNPLSAFDTLYEALAAVRRECAELAAATATADMDAAWRAASTAVRELLVAEAAHRRLDRKNRFVDAILAQVAIGAAYRAIVHQFTRVVQQTSSLDLHCQLHQLRVSLTIAFGAPPTFH